MQRSVVLVVCLLALVTLVRADSYKTVSCITVSASLSPYYTYAVALNTTNNGVCCEICAHGAVSLRRDCSIEGCLVDEKCVAWTREWSTGNCHLKNDTDCLLKVWGVDSGIKHIGYGVPTLLDNDLNAFVIVGKKLKPVAPPPPPPAPKKKRTSVSVSVSASSTGGSSVARASATPDTFSSYSSVTGSGTASTSVENSKISFASTLTKKSGEYPKYAVKYYEKPEILGELKTVSAKRIPYIIPKTVEPVCNVCPGVPCLYKEHVSYQAGGDWLYEEEVDYADLCCQACRYRVDCLSWYWDPYSKICVLNSNLPVATYYVDAAFVGGTAV